MTITEQLIALKKKYSEYLRWVLQEKLGRKLIQILSS